MKTVTKTIRINRLTKLHDFLRKLPASEFYFGNYVKYHDDLKCGTVCCAIGWLPTVDKKNWKWIIEYGDQLTPVFDDYKDENAAGQAYFGISYAMYSDLFLPSLDMDDPNIDELVPLRSSATAKQVANNIMMAIKLLKADKLNEYIK